MNDKNKFKEIERNIVNRFTAIQSELRREDQNYHFEFKVKKFLMNLNFNSGKEFVFSWNNIDSVNDKYFATLNAAGD